ncbi:MAG TPA: cell division protein FtsK [Paenibacillaceae bacterium]|nr:cell division protein FtsK [Paenibacillaceae bacterium]
MIILAKKRKRNKKGVRESLRYELYGLVIIALSLLALLTFSNSSFFGRYVSWAFRVIAGSWDFLIPLFGIGVGVYLMLKRSWPIFYTPRWLGFFLLFYTLLIWNHTLFVDAITAGGKFQQESIISITWQQLLQEKMQWNNGNPSTTDVGGGIGGALGYAFLSYVVSPEGIGLVLVFMILIGILLAFKLSYVRSFSLLKNLIQRGGKRVGEVARDSWELIRDQREEKKGISSTGKHTMVDEEPSFPGEEEIIIYPTATSEDGFTHTMNHENSSQREETVIHDFTEKVQKQENNIKVVLKEREFPIKFADESVETFYRLPNLDLLEVNKNVRQSVSSKSMQGNARKLESTLESFGVQAKVLQVHRGPAVTRYELQPAIGVKVSRIVSLTDDIALALAARGIRIEAPIPGKSAIGIEVPNDEISLVSLREVIESDEYGTAKNALSLALGRDIAGRPIVANLAKMPHLLVAGATGSGKSVCINSIILSILYKAKPSEVKFMMIDPKMVELNIYNGIPHLLAPVVTDPRRASMALKKVVQEMERRYELFAKEGARDIERYNLLAQEAKFPPLPLIVVIVDELADLMMVAPSDVEDAICRLAQMARAAGIHLIIATQRPSVDVITGVIKANIPSRIAFGVSSMADSRTILDMGGAEKLLGRGDMLFLPVGAAKPIRVQGCFISDHDVEAVVAYAKEQQAANYDEEMILPGENNDSRSLPEDDLYNEAVALVRDTQTASASLLQRRLRVGYTRAARLIDMMEARGVVGPYEGSKPRDVLLPRNDSQIS